MKTREEYEYWIGLALEYIVIAKESVKKSKTKSPPAMGLSVTK